jgi:hypothetical protein
VTVSKKKDQRDEKESRRIARQELEREHAGFSMADLMEIARSTRNAGMLADVKQALSIPNRR